MPAIAAIMQITAPSANSAESTRSASPNPAHRPRVRGSHSAFTVTVGGTAYIMQLSIIAKRRMAEPLDRHGYQAQVVDFTA